MAKILVLMSGGVDSSTTAALLMREGYEVAGVYLKLWESIGGGPASVTTEAGPPNIGDPCWASEMRDAARVAAHLGIPFNVWDVTDDYKKRVLENFYSEYAAGRTPNPDVLCNSEIKFGVALKRALAAGFDYVATGHYARVHNPTPPPLNLRGGESENVPPLKSDVSVGLRTVASELRGGEGELWAAVDKNKDQSYFLWRLTQNQLAHTMFPIGEYTKPQVRALARKVGLHNWNKKDSQGVCFLGKIKLKEFLYRRPLLTSPSKGEENSSFPLLVEEGLGVVPPPGPIVDVRGNLLGFHDGLTHFTIGQRHGTKLGGTGPYFVVEKDMTTNTLVVVHESEEDKYRAVEAEVSGVRCQVPDIASHDGFRCMARTRYRAPLVKISLRSTGQPSASQWVVIFEEPQRAVAPGQSIVFYDDDRVLGGGVIDSVVLKTPLEICKVPKYVSVS